MSRYDSYYAMQNAKRKFEKSNPGVNWNHVGTDVQDSYIDPEMEKRGYKRNRYIGAGAWEWTKV